MRASALIGCALGAGCSLQSGSGRPPATVAAHVYRYSDDQGLSVTTTDVAASVPRLTPAVAVVHPNATLADGFSTAAFVLGPERALALARRLGFEVALVDARGGLQMTPGLRQRLRMRHPPLR